MRRLFAGVVVLVVVHSVLAWLGILTLLFIGAVWLITAHPAHPVLVAGFVSTSFERFQDNKYQETRFTLSQDPRTFSFEEDVFSPTIPSGRPWRGEPVQFWIDPDINWVNLGTSEVLAMTLSTETPAARPAHTTRHFNDPSSAVADQRLAGAVMLGFAALIIILSGLWEWWESGSTRTARRITGRLAA